MADDYAGDYTIKQLLYPDSTPQCLQAAPKGVSVEVAAEYDGNAGLSRAIWRSANPGYLSPTSDTWTSTAHQDFVWDPQEIAFLKSKGLFGKQFNRKRDKFTAYVEAEAQTKALSQKHA